MPSTQYQSRRLYYLHVFKDNAASNWTNPTVHVFPLSSLSAHKFSGRSNHYARSGQKGQPGNRDGLVNLFRLPSHQLSFLEQYVGKLNTEVEEKKAKLIQDWKASIQQEEKEKFEQEMKRNEEKKALLELKRQYLKEKRQESNNSADKGGGQASRIRNRRSNRYGYDSDCTAREGYVSYDDDQWEVTRPSRYRERATRRGGNPPAPNPASLETPWTIEQVELSFVPETVSLVEVPHPRTGFGGLRSYRLPNGPDEANVHKTAVNLEVATNAIAPESFSSFAVVLSRCVGVEIPRDDTGVYRRDMSPARSYYSDIHDRYDDDQDFVQAVETFEPIFPPGPPPPPLSLFGCPPGRFNWQPAATRTSEEQGDTKAKKDAEKDDHEDALETESKAGEEGEDCGEGTVYVNVVKKAD